ncbi:MAG: pilus assembly protein [Gammaproteobacteria bacterium]|nr:pilus assembly protein [Gammaproteobacteria bacterium]
MSARRRQRGATTVEFAIVGLLLVIVVFAVIEFGRIVFTLNMLQEGARRAARVAAVCRVNDPLVAQKAVFAAPHGVPGLDTSYVHVEYLDQSGADSGGDYSSTAYVRVRIAGYPMHIFLPLLSPAFTAPEYSVTLPRESLGIPRIGEPPACD